MGGEVFGGDGRFLKKAPQKLSADKVKLADGELVGMVEFFAGDFYGRRAVFR